jgi:hypothetical protein
VLALVVACDARGDTAKASAPPPKQRFLLLNKQHRPATADAIAKTFPAAWHPVVIERHYRPGSRIPGIEELPDFVDAHTLAPLSAPTLGIYRPGDGAYAAGVPTFGPRFGFDFAGCFE